MPPTSGRHPSGEPRRIVTLTSDFGLRDSYVAAMKGVLLRHCPDARLIDVTHLVPRHDILCASITLERAVDGFPPGTVHLVVVDPGVGTDRRILIVQINAQVVVCPDNGLITWSWRLHPGARTAHELGWRPQRKPSATFHGRDILAPAAGMIACGEAISRLAREVNDPVLLDVAPANPKTSRGQVIQIDHFGNATTNIPYDHIRQEPGIEVRIKGKKLGRIKRTYWDVAPGRPLALIGSSGLLEIAVRDGSAARELRLAVGDEVALRPAPATEQGRRRTRS